MSEVPMVPVRSTPGQIVSQMPWSRITIDRNGSSETVSRARVHRFIILVRDNGAWSVHVRENAAGDAGHVISQGRSRTVSWARRDAATSLLGMCEAAAYVFKLGQLSDPEIERNFLEACRATVGYMQGYGTPED